MPRERAVANLFSSKKAPISLRHMLMRGFPYSWGFLPSIYHSSSQVGGNLQQHTSLAYSNFVLLPVFLMRIPLP
jgi:hypothetical protein